MALVVVLGGLESHPGRCQSRRPVPHLLLVVALVVAVAVSIEVVHGQPAENKYKKLNFASHEGCHPYAAGYNTYRNIEYFLLADVPYINSTCKLLMSCP